MPSRLFKRIGSLFMIYSFVDSESGIDDFTGSGVGLAPLIGDGDGDAAIGGGRVVDVQTEKAVAVRSGGLARHPRQAREHDEHVAIQFVVHRSLEKPGAE